MKNGNSYTDQTGGINWSVIRLPMPGEDICGDRFIVKQINNSVLVGVLDGLGHGGEAAFAGKKAISVLQDQPSFKRLDKLFDAVHDALITTRGVVMSLGVFDLDRNELTWLGVGNIKGVLLQNIEGDQYNHVHMTQWGGVLGYRLPDIVFKKIHTYELHKGDKLIFATDGIEDNFINGVYPFSQPNHIVNLVSKKYFLKTDDALILAAQFEGSNNEP